MDKRKFIIYVESEDIINFNNIVDNNFDADSISVTYKGTFWSEYEIIVSEEELMLLKLTINDIDIRDTVVDEYFKD